MTTELRTAWLVHHHFDYDDNNFTVFLDEASAVRHAGRIARDEAKRRDDEALENYWYEDCLPEQGYFLRDGGGEYIEVQEVPFYREVDT